MAISKPSLGSSNWGVTLNATLDELDAEKLDVTTAGATYASVFATPPTFRPESFLPQGVTEPADWTDAITAAIDAAYAVGVGVVRFRARRYLVNGPNVTSRGGNAIIALKNVAAPQGQATADGPVVVLEGAAPAEQCWPGGGVYSGTVIETTRTNGTYSGSAGLPSVIGGPTREGNSGNLSVQQVVIRNLAVAVPQNPSFTGVDLDQIARVDLDGLNVTINNGVATNDVIAEPTHKHAVGLRTPDVANYDKVILRSVLVSGYYVGWHGNMEHITATDVTVNRCYIGFAPRSRAAGHSATIQKLSSEFCAYSIAPWDPVAGLFDFDGVIVLDVALLDIERTTAGVWWSPIVDIYDPSNLIRGRIGYSVYDRDGGSLLGGRLRTSGAENVKLFALKATSPYDGPGASGESVTARASFSAADGPLLAAEAGGTWTHAGTHTPVIVKRTAVDPSPDDPAGSLLSYLTLATGDGQYSVDVDLGAPGTFLAGLLLRFVDINNYLSFYVNNRGDGSPHLIFQRTVSGATTTLWQSINTATEAKRTTRNLKAVLSQLNVQLYADGNLVGAVTLPALAPNGIRHGLIAYRAVGWGWRNFRATSDL